MIFVLINFSLPLYLKTVITMINQAIGAEGVVSQECKAVAQQYGQTIMNLLLAEVKVTAILVYFFFSCEIKFSYRCFYILS